MRSAEETAVILAVMFNRVQSTRARISEKTIRIMSGRRRIGVYFQHMLIEALSEFDYGLVHAPGGGYVIFKISSLTSTSKILRPALFSSAELEGLKYAEAAGREIYALLMLELDRDSPLEVNEV